MCDIGGYRREQASYDRESVEEQIYFRGVNLRKIGFSVNLFFCLLRKLGSLLEKSFLCIFFEMA